MKLIKNLKRIIKLCLFKSKLRNKYALLPIYGLGETTVCASLMKDFKSKFSKKNILLVKNDNFVEYVKHFEGVDDAISIELNDTLKIFFDKNAITTPQLGKIYPLNLKNVNIENLDNSNMFQAYKSMLFKDDRKNINFSNNFVINSQDEKKIIKKYKLEEKENIFIIPDSNALNNSCLTNNYWKILIQKLNQMGFNVIVNTKENCFNEKITSVYESIYDTILIANNCKCIISFRTGLIDAIAATTTKPYIISYYPSTDYQIYSFATNEEMVKELQYRNSQGKMELDEGFSEFIIKIHSLVDMYIRSNCKELLIKEDNKTDVLSKTLEIVGNSK